MYDHRSKQRIRFDNFSFRIPPWLCAEKDGSEQRGENLFVYDPQEKYMICFESNMPCFSLLLRGNEKYSSEEFTDERLRVGLCYPVSRKEDRSCMVYFHAELPGPSGGVCLLPGQMNLSAGSFWSPEPKDMLLEVLRSVEVRCIGPAC